jgi:hypothetical protein
MDVAAARALLKTGILKEALLKRTENSDGWIVELRTSPPSETLLILETQKGAIRIFKSCETAYDTLIRIGFSRVTTILSD